MSLRWANRICPVRASCRRADWNLPASVSRGFSPAAAFPEETGPNPVSMTPSHAVKRCFLHPIAIPPPDEPDRLFSLDDNYRVLY